MIKSMQAIIVAAAIILLPTSAMASDWSVDAYVIRVEPSYIPDRVQLQIDVTAGNCLAGSWIQWVAKGGDSQAKEANAQAVLATVMTALTAERKITLVGNNAGCSLDFIHLVR